MIQNITDSLTGLYNRRYIFQRAQDIVDNSLRYRRPLSFIMFDIDFFKPYNDNLGHIEGDRALSLVGRITKDNIRKVDLPGRYGGEEFCVILPETSLDYGIEVAEQVRTSVEKETKPPNLAKGITISLGLAELRENNTLTDLIADADSKLYCAKKSGRNKLAY